MEEKNEQLEEFVLSTGSIVATMRLLIEGAITLYDDEAGSLFHLGLSNNLMKASSAFDVIGTALFELRTHIMDLQERHMKGIGRKRRSMDVYDEHHDE